MADFEIKSEVIDCGIKELLRRSGIDKGLLLMVNKCEKLIYCCNNLKLNHGFRVSVTVLKSPNRDYKKGESWDFEIPLHFKSVNEYFSDKYEIS